MNCKGSTKFSRGLRSYLGIYLVGQSFQTANNDFSGL
jgi:hypothetical protein